MTLPNFLIIGAAKAGTTALYSYLAQHPAVFMSENKEPRFFDLEGQRPCYTGPGDAAVVHPTSVTERARYEALFRHARGRSAIGEASVAYLASEQAPERIRRSIPEARLIVMLRNPVDRAFSSYLHLVRDGREPAANFEQALREEQTRISAGWEPLWHYTRLGFYHEQLMRYCQRFPRQQIAVYLYDDFIARPAEVLRAIFGFLGIDQSFAPDTSRRHNQAGRPRSRLLQQFLWRPHPIKQVLKPLFPSVLRQRLVDALKRGNLVEQRQRMAQETRAQLTELFRQDILKLQTLLCRDLSAWLAYGPHPGATRHPSPAAAGERDRAGAPSATAEDRAGAPPSPVATGEGLGVRA